MKCYLTIKMNDILIHAKTWMNLENTQSEGNHKRSHIMRFQLYKISGVGKSTEIESRLVVAYC